MDLFAYPILDGFLSTLGAKSIMARKGYSLTVRAFRVRAFVAGKSSQGATTTQYIGYRF